jgi:hypothetical protein
LECLLRGLDGVIRLGHLDEEVAAPIITLAIAMIGFARPRGQQRQCASAEIHIPARLARLVRRDALNVLHERHRVFEDGVVDALEDVAHQRASLIKDGAVRVVDVANAVRRSFLKSTVDLEMAGYQSDVVFDFHFLE